MSCTTLLQPPILWQPDDYVLFQKCGEIIVSPDIQNIGYNCLFCAGVCLQSDIFLQHLQEQHREDVYKMYGKQHFQITTNYLNGEMLGNLSDLNIRNAEIQINEEIENNPQENYIISNSLVEPKEVLSFSNDLNLVYDLNTNDLLTLTTSSTNQELENLITLNPLKNLANTIDTTTTTTTTIVNNTCMSTSFDCLKCLTADNECEIGDGEDSGIMLAQSPSTTPSSECGGFSDCMSFTEDNSSNKSIHTRNGSWESTEPDFTEKYTTTKIFNNKQEKLEQSPKSKYINTPAMRKALNNHELIAYLLEAYKKNEKLWNPQHPCYKYNAHRTMYNELSQPLLNDMEYSLTGVEIFGIINQLRGRYRRELTKFEKCKGKHKTRLWYFDKMAFLRSIIEEKREERKRTKSLENQARNINDKDLSNREILSYLLKLYRDYECLWNTQDIQYNMSDKSVVYENITEQMKNKFNIKWSHTECMNEIQKLLIRYRKELRIFYKLKGLYIPKLWCFDEMEFLKPAMEEKIFKNLKKNFNYTSKDLSQRKHEFSKASEIVFNNLDQQLKFIEIYRNYNSLWDVDHPDYRSANYRRKALNDMLEEIKSTLNFKCLEITQLEKTLYVLRKDYAAEKRKRVMYSRESENEGPLPKNKIGLSIVLYEKLNLFLANNLGPFRCDNCQLICKTYDQYKIHKSKHDGSPPFICTLCGKGFQMPGNLTIHIRRHRRDFPYACEICQKSFATSTEVSIHMRSHTGERPYECELCNKTFKTWSFFDLHKRAHLKQSNFHCPICDKSFYERNRFTDHMNIHLNIRKHQCGKCEKSFTTIGNLKKHSDLHAPLKKYKCKPCGKRFKQFASLRWHRKTQHEE